MSIFIWNASKTNKTYLVANTKCKSKPLRGASTHLVFDVVVGRWWFWRWWPYFIWNWKMPVKNAMCWWVFYMKWAQKQNKTYLVANTKCKSKPLRGASTHLVFDVVAGRRWFWRWEQKSPRGGLRRWPGRWRGDFRRFQAEGGEISAAAVRVGCQRRREGGFRVVSWRGEVARRRKSHGGGGSTSGGFVGWKNEQGFDVCGSVGRFRLTRWKIAKEKVCRYVSRENLRVSHRICAKSRRSIDSNQIC